MIKKDKIGGIEGYLCHGEKKGFFIARSKGAMPNGARYDKVTITGTYNQAGNVLLVTKKLSARDKTKNKTIATASINTEMLPELIQALTMLAMDLGSGKKIDVEWQDRQTEPEQKEKDEVQEWLESHPEQRGRVIA